MANILVADDDLDIGKLLERFLTRHQHKVNTAINGKTALQLVQQINFDVVFCDFRLPDMDAREFIEQAHKINPYLKIIVITGYSDVKIAVDVIKKGALDYVIKPLLPEEILSLVNKAINTTTPTATSSTAINSSVSDNIDYNKATTAQKTNATTATDKFLKGTSKAANKMNADIALVAPTNFSVIIYGESGAGKENVARSIHNLSARNKAPFIAVDCGALTKELAGSELWGHEKGSFTGAANTKLGQFELANGGTIFLDEIANLSYDIQVGLLRLVQERKLRRIGGVKDIEIDVRIIVASNENLLQAVQKGKFREDLYYRFNEFNVTVPALRHRDKDIMKFADHFLDIANTELAKNITGFSNDVIELFNSYHWPGNLREMRNVVRRATLLCNGSSIDITSVPQEIVHYEKFAIQPEIDPQNTTVEQPTSSTPNINTQQLPDLKMASANAEAEVLKKVLEEVKYNRTKAALKLGIDRKTLFNKMKLYNL